MRLDLLDACTSGGVCTISESERMVDWHTMKRRARAASKRWRKNVLQKEVAKSKYFTAEPKGNWSMRQCNQQERGVGLQMWWSKSERPKSSVITIYGDVGYRVWVALLSQNVSVWAAYKKETVLEIPHWSMSGTSHLCVWRHPKIDCHKHKVKFVHCLNISMPNSPKSIRIQNMTECSVAYNRLPCDMAHTRAILAVLQWGFLDQVIAVDDE